MLDHLRRFATPGGIPPRTALLTSLLATVVLFAIDVQDGPSMRLDVLYMFPLATIALHADRGHLVIIAVAASVALQVLTLLSYGLPHDAIVTDELIAFAASVLVVYLARAVRVNYLETMSLATSDALTGLTNRRGFEAIIELEIARQKRYGGVFSLAMLDLDNFKELNDSSGHLAGDQALTLAADVLRNNARHSDTIARLGGDEFSILLLNTQPADCRPFLQGIAAKLAEQMAAAGFAVTASIGCVTFNAAPESLLDALRSADRAMYAAKAAGKSRVVFL
jgi:diguanylate cyclase (GGDEF)-like protein